MLAVLKTVIDYEERPWEYPGARRDYEPHRGPVLLLLGNIALACNVVCLGPLALPLAIAVWVMAREDLEKMAAGFMDPAGKRSTEIAFHRAVGSVLLGIGTMSILCVRLFVLR